MSESGTRVRLGGGGGDREIHGLNGGDRLHLALKLAGPPTRGPARWPARGRVGRAPPAIEQPRTRVRRGRAHHAVDILFAVRQPRGRGGQPEAVHIESQRTVRGLLPRACAHPCEGRRCHGASRPAPPPASLPRARAAVRPWPLPREQTCCGEEGRGHVLPVCALRRDGGPVLEPLESACWPRALRLLLVPLRTPSRVRDWHHSRDTRARHHSRTTTPRARAEPSTPDPCLSPCGEARARALEVRCAKKHARAARNRGHSSRILARESKAVGIAAALGGSSQALSRKQARNHRGSS